MEVRFLEDAVTYLNELVEVLFAEGYFGFKESAFHYVDDIYDTIASEIGNMRKKNAPEYFSKYGKDMQYATYRRSKNTQWYVFFTHENGVYYVRYIANNHSIAQYL